MIRCCLTFLPPEALPGLPHCPLALHPALFALGDKPSSLSQLAQDAATGNLLTESPQELFLRFSRLEFNSHLALLTSSPAGSSRESSDSSWCASASLSENQKSRSSSYRPAWGQQPRPSTGQTIPQALANPVLRDADTVNPLLMIIHSLTIVKCFAGPPQVAREVEGDSRLTYVRGAPIITDRQRVTQILGTRVKLGTTFAR